MAILRIKDLKLRTIIGINDWERKTLQDVTLNIELEFDERKAIESDNIADTVDYKALKKDIMRHVENSQYYLIEKLGGEVLDLVMKDTKITAARIRVDKPQALRFARSVSIEIYQTRETYRS